MRGRTITVDESPTLPVAIAGVLRGERAVHRMTISVLAARADVQPARMGMYLRGVCEISGDALQRVAAVLGTTAEEITRTALAYLVERATRFDAFGAFSGTPEELESALWPLGVRLRTPQDCSRWDEKNGRRTIGEVDWWPDDSEIVVTPDLRSTNAERITLLRKAERMLLDPNYPHSTPQILKDGARYCGIYCSA